MIDELEHLEQAATAQRWRVESHRIVDQDGTTLLRAPVARDATDYCNLELAAAARNALPALLRVARAAGELEEILAAVAADADDADVLVMRRQAARAELRAALAALEGRRDA